MLGGGGKANGRFYDFQRPLPSARTVNIGSNPVVRDSNRTPTGAIPGGADTAPEAGAVAG